MCVHSVDGFHYDNVTVTNIRQLQQPGQYVEYIEGFCFKTYCDDTGWPKSNFTVW